MTLDIGVVGTGMMGQDHVQRLATSVPHAKVVAVSDVNVDQAKRVGESVAARVYSDGHDLIADEQVQAVLIASPGFTHRNASVPPGFTSDMMITDSVVHDIDVTRWLLGQEIVAASVFRARPSSMAPEGLQDPQMVLLETAAGVLVDVESFVSCQFGYDIRYELVGETGTISLGEQAGVQIRQQGRHHGPIPADWRERFGAAYQRELQEWVTGALQGQIAGPSTWDGYATTAVAVAAVESLAGGRRTPVELVDRPALYA